VKFWYHVSRFIKQDLQDLLDIEVALRQSYVARLRAIEQIITDMSLAPALIRSRAYIVYLLHAKRKTAEKALREKSRRVTVRNDALR
jgi:hypothetical protein